MRKLLLLAAIIIVACTGYIFYTRQQTTVVTQAKAPEYQTVSARRGNLVITTLGSGSLVAGKEVNLAFSTTGTVAVLKVKVGDTVKTGDVLAQLKEIEPLKATVYSAELDLLTAKKALTTLQSTAAGNLAQAQLDLVKAQKAYDDAMKAVKPKGVSRCDTQSVEQYYDAYLLYQKQLDAFGYNGANPKLYVDAIAPLKKQRDEALATYQYCSGFTNYEIESSRVQVVLTKTKLDDAQKNYDTLMANNGIDANDLAVAKNKISQAEVSLKTAQDNLEGATIKSTMDGKVTVVTGKVGDSAGKSTFITVADLMHPYVEFYVDEADMDKVALGYPAQITFDALSGSKFTGKVYLIEPSLVTVSNYKAIKGLAEINLGTRSEPLPKGLNASVEITAGRADNAVLVSVDALRTDNGKTVVYVLGSSGQPELRVVEVGLQDLSNAQITKGLQVGEQVVLGSVEAKQ